MDNQNSGVNTVLLVIVLVLLVGFGVWWFSGHRGVAPATQNQNNPGVNLDVNLPSGGNNDGGATGGTSGTTGGTTGGGTGY
jgi:hypothetical protein